MATRDLNQDYSAGTYPADLPATFLPAFPDARTILAALPLYQPGTSRLGKANFVTFVDFTLENPDEIWELEESEGVRLYHYLSFLDRNTNELAFAVEVVFFEDLMEVNDFTLLVRAEDVKLLRSGRLVYGREKEWEKEKLVRALNERALTRYDENRLDEARELIDTAIRLSGTACAYLFNNRGLICWKMGRVDEAKRDFLESITLDEGNGDPYFNIGLIYFDEADFRRALHYLGRAVEINPADSQFLTELGHLYLEMEREEEALRLFDRAFQNDPADAQVDFHLGHYFLYKKQEPWHAVKYYLKGLKKDPSDQLALADLALAHWILGNTRKCLEIHKIIQRNPNLMPYTISRLVYLNMEMGHYEKALRYYQEALSQQELFEPEWLHYHAALIYAKTGRTKQAISILDLAVRAGGDAVVKKALTEDALRQLKRMPDFKKVVRLSPKRRNR
ncbi:MAG: tetratricopeptide repeat protein [Desulfomonilaceae bacterium]|nr:tetratricopeptide repeat protein [Desulfomonilaceae bacterium]